MIASESAARAAGLTRPVFAESSNGEFQMQILVDPAAELDGEFRVYDRDACEMLCLRGWMFLIEEESE